MPAEDEGVVLRLVPVDGILRKSALPPGINAAHPVEVQVNVEIDKPSPPDLVGMPCRFQIFLAVIPGADAQGLTAVDAERPLPV